MQKIKKPIILRYSCQNIKKQMCNVCVICVLAYCINQIKHLDFKVLKKSVAYILFNANMCYENICAFYWLQSHECCECF